MNRRLLLTTGVAAVAVAGYFGWTRRGSNAPDLSTVANAPAQDAAHGNAASPEVSSANAELVPDMSIGNPDAKVTVIEYASYTCPHCANFHNGEAYSRLKEEYLSLIHI